MENISYYEKLDKIRSLFNKLNAKIFNFYKLDFSNKSNAFKILQVHEEELLSHLKYKKNILGQSTLLVFNELFVGNNDFKDYDENNEKYLEKLINYMNNKKTSILQNELISLIIDNYNIISSDLISTLIENITIDLEIKLEYKYLLYLYLFSKGFNIENIWNFLCPIIIEKFPFSTIDLSDNLLKNINLTLSLKEFLEKFYNIIKNIKGKDYFILKYSEKKNEFIVEDKSIDDIFEIINEKEENIIIKEEINKNSPKGKEKKQEYRQKEVSKEISKNKNEERIKLKTYSQDNNGNNGENANNNNKIDTSIPKEEKSEYSDKSEKDWKCKYNILKKKYEDLEKKYNNLKGNYDNIKLKNKEIAKKEKELNEIINQREKDISILRKQKYDKNLKIAELEFKLDCVGLRTAYKSLIQIFLKIFNIEEKGNIDKKCSIIYEILEQYNNQNARIIKLIIEKSLRFIKDFNSVAHNINYDKMLNIKIADFLVKHHNLTIYKKIISIFEKMNIEKPLLLLTKANNQRYYSGDIYNDYLEKAESKIAEIPSLKIILGL